MVPPPRSPDRSVSPPLSTKRQKRSPGESVNSNNSQVMRADQSGGQTVVGSNSTVGGMSKNLQEKEHSVGSTLKDNGSTDKATKATKRMTTGVMDYVQSVLPREALLELYSDETRGQFVCRAVLQQIPETSQQVVVRLSCTDGSFPLSMIQIWMATTTTGGGSSSSNSNSVVSPRLLRQLEEMYRWAIITQSPSALAASGPEAAATASIRLTDGFCRGLKKSLCSLDASPWIAMTPQQVLAVEEEVNTKPGLVDDHEKPVRYTPQTPENLEAYTQSQWDAVLHYMVGTPGQSVMPNLAVQSFLTETNLMQPDPDYKPVPNGRGGTKLAPLVITEKGYDFMLRDSAQQVWHFVVQYLMKVDAAPGMQREVLLLLICLSFARFGECYHAASLNKDSRKIIKDLSFFGLLYVQGPIKKTRYQVFYPTRIAMQMVGGEKSNNGGTRNGGAGGGGGMWSLSTKALESALAHPRPHDSSHLAIIVQTNFQLCAYTTSELHVSMLGLFCEVQTIRRLPNVVFMTISRDSVKGAFNLGIKAQQILRFLEKHAHPKLRQCSMDAGGSPLPPNVVDQIFLWDRERHRVIWDEVFVHKSMMAGEFHAVQTYAMELGAYAWSSEARNQIMIKYDKAQKVQSFVQKWRAKAASGRS